MIEYPIPVERYTGDMALTIACKNCHSSRVITADEIYNEDLYDCPRECGGWASMKYAEADKCKNCGLLGFYDLALNGCCSRACMLQAEYAETLRGTA
jgi:hypothetical protein